jgi:hypothetical protein
VDYKKKLAQAVNLDALRKQREQVQQYVTQLEKQLPSKARWTPAVRHQPGRPRSKPHLRSLPSGFHQRQGVLRRTCRSPSGDRPYHDIGSFASDIAHLSRIVTLNNLEINQGKDGNLTMDSTCQDFPLPGSGGSGGAAQGDRQGRKEMRHKLLLALVAAAALSACNGTEQDEVNRWMAEQRATTKPQVQPIPEPKSSRPRTTLWNRPSSRSVPRN